ncbi:MAG: N-acetylmuramoyl-L-alanine amidase [Bacilli bacterium]|nr:N-acetylmuramoyl-L-alanine amidase [Bacilli bacterium]
MKKIFTFLLLLGIGFIVYAYFFGEQENLYRVLSNTEKTEVSLNKYYIYGRHLNMEGTLETNSKNVEDVKLLFKESKKDEIEYDIEYSIESGILNFKISNEINTGINLDKIKIGNYYVLLKVVYDEETTKYYSINNNCEYDEIEYYTISKNDKTNKVLVEFDKKAIVDNNKNYTFIKVKEMDMPENIYDIVIDPGHGGKDSGAIKDNYYEKDITLEYGKMLKESLEKLGLKVKLTRDGKNEENLGIYDIYGNNGRAVIPNKVKAKYALSIHLNSAAYKMKNGGVEVYAPANANLDFAKLLADNIVESSDTTYSPSEVSKVYDGVYVRTYTKSEIKSAESHANNNGYEPYNITTSTPYYFMIRETGGIITNAYVDGRNKDYEKNPYYDSNIGVETYLIELGFMNSSKDFEKIINNKEEYVKGIMNAIKKYLNL